MVVKRSRSHPLARRRDLMPSSSPRKTGCGLSVYSQVIVATPITWEYTDSPHPVFLGLLEGIKSRLRASGCDLLLFTTIDPDPDAYLRRCHDSGVRGVI